MNEGGLYMCRIKNIIILMAACLLILAGCTADGGKFLDYQAGIRSAEVSWTIGEREYSATITLGESAENATVAVTDPTELEGVSVTYSPEGAEASVGSVRMPLPDNMGREVYRIVRSLSFSEDEIKGAGNATGEVTAVRFEVPLYGGTTEYNVLYGDDKMPKSAEVKWDGGELNVRYIGFR